MPRLLRATPGGSSELAIVSLFGAVGVRRTQTGHDHALQTFHVLGVVVGFVIVPYKMQHPVRHKVLQMMGEAMDEREICGDARTFLSGFFDQVADFMRNSG